MTVLVHTPDVIGDRMAGPGIRAWHIARELAKHTRTVLVAKREGAVPRSSSGSSEFLGERDPAEELRGTPRNSEEPIILPHGSPEAKHALRTARVLIGQPARGFGKRRPGQRIAYDLFDPTVLELRELYGAAPSLRQRIHLGAEWWRLTEALMRADLLICAARKQRRLYETLQSNDAPWIEVPFGIDLADTLACAKPQDNLVVWGGGVWEWLDPSTAVEAVVRVNAEGVRCRLLFLGRSRPNPQTVDRRRESRFDDLLLRGGPYVSANAEWVPYSERLAWLRAGKIAIMLHRRTAEAEYSIRTRLFDAIAAGIPVVATAGGFAADLVAREGLGLVVPPGDVAAVAAAIRRLLTDDALFLGCVQNLERIRPRFAWETVTQPLVDAVLEWLK